MPALRVIRCLPPLLMLAALGVCGVLGLARPWLGGAVPGAYAGWAPALVGVVNTVPPAPPTVANVEAGRAQAAVMATFNEALPQRALMVRGFNDLLWRVSGGSYMSSGSIATGNANTLQGWPWLLYDCGHAIRPGEAAMRGFAARLRRVQDWLDSRGQPFAYLLATPKPPMTRSTFEGLLPCARDGDDPYFATYVASLRAAGVRVVASREVLRAAPATTPLYPRFGLHWNELGAALAGQALVATLRSAGADLPEFRFQVGTRPAETGDDVDFLQLLNLLHAPPSPPAPEVVPARSTAAQRPSLAIVGDSFVTGLSALFERAGLFRHTDIFDYLVAVRRTWEPWLANHPLDLDSPQAFAPLLEADIVVLEEADHRGPGPFATYFVELMEHAMANGGALLPPSRFPQ